MVRNLTATQQAELIRALQELPEEKVQEVIDFTNYLWEKYARPRPPRGSAEAILEALEQGGPLQFEPGELERLLTEIEQMREMDLEEHG
ncbi:MAG: DUF2281 domain-containing protein [Anaerolineae bacterium]